MTRLVRAPVPIVLSPTSVRDLDVCPRRFFLAHVLRLDTGPRPDEDDGGGPGLSVHDELAARHDDSAAGHDQAEALTAAGGAPEVGRLVANHRSLCPRAEAEYLGGEIDLRWFLPRIGVLLTGRADAVWRYPDGTIEVRDYKTGACPATLDDDRAAQMYALLIGARRPRPPAIRVVYEELAGDRPRAVAVDADRDFLRRAYDRVVEVAKRVSPKRAEFAPTPSAGACRYCRYRALCPAAFAAE